MPETSAEIVKKAELFALSLTSGPTPVGRGALLAITSEFLSSPQPDRDRLKRIVELIGKGSGGHLLRGGGYGEQVRTAVAELAHLLSEDLSDRDLQSLLGWTARLLLVRREPQAAERSAPTRQDARPARSGARQPSESRRPQVSSPLSALDKKSMSTLERLKKTLSEQEPPKKD